MVNINKLSNNFQFNHENISFEKVFDAKFEKIKIRNKNYLFIDQKIIENLAEKAFFEISHFLRTSHLKKLQKILMSKMLKEWQQSYKKVNLISTIFFLK